ncbi:Diacylglycerol kinase theta, partial [Galemys pyrenaicus]
PRSPGLAPSTPRSSGWVPPGRRPSAQAQAGAPQAQRCPAATGAACALAATGADYAPAAAPTLAAPPPPPAPPSAPPLRRAPAQWRPGSRKPGGADRADTGAAGLRGSGPEPTRPARSRARAAGPGMAAAADPGARAPLGGGPPRPAGPASSPETGVGGRARPGRGSGRAGAAPGHRFRKVTLTKPTFCHLCSDFIWGLGGFLCDAWPITRMSSPACNFMSHEKCLKLVLLPCARVASRLVRVPVAHCFGPRGLYKRKFCSVCRKALEAPALRCEVCELHVHPDCVPFACSDCRQCHRDGHRDHVSAAGRGRRQGGAVPSARRPPPPQDPRDPQHHHWREGNLPSGARCEVCRKACGSSDVLAGVRCEWCGVQAHSVCSAVLTSECTFGVLRSLILPPTCVRLLSRNFSKMHCFRIAESPAEPGERWAVRPPARACQGVRWAGPGHKQALRIFDGDDAVQRNRFLLVAVPRLARSEEVLELALRAFYLPEEPGDFQLQALPARKAASGAPGDEGGRDPRAREAGPEAWVLRALPRPQEVLHVYPTWPRVGVAYVSILVTPQSTAGAVVQEVLPLLGRQAEGPESFQLVEVVMGSRQVQWTPLADSEPLLDRLREMRQTSLRQMNQARFYVAASRAVAPRVSLFVGGLPLGLPAPEYCSLLDEALAPKAGLVSLSHVYPAQGALVLEVACFAEAERLYVLVRDTAVQGRPLSALVLPDVLHTELPPDCCPLLVFVNPKSGGLKGRDLLSSFRKLLNPHQVFELTHGGPLPGLHLFSRLPRFRVLVCGGDGTVGWVLAGLEEMRRQLACPDPPVAILPLGTGNDLGRVLRWGPGYSGEDPLSVLLAVDEADAVLVDRWTILLAAQDTGGGEGGSADVEPPKVVQMSNYCGIGIDAELSLDFHQAREEEPGKFTSRLHNKGVYVRVGLQKMSQARGLHRELRLQVEQQEVELPSLEGLIFINIPSWGSGADLWGADEDTRFEKPRMDDGLLEVVGVTGVMHMGQVQGGLRSGIRIAQGSYFRVTLLKATPVQVDGEPWVQAPGHMIISAASPKVHMLRKAKPKPRKAGNPKDTPAEGAPAPGGGSE